jgi:hypothetical protein
MTWRAATAGILVAFAVGLIAWDTLVAIKAGNSATISQVLYQFSKQEPIVCVALGIVVGHLFWPQAKRHRTPGAGGGAGPNPLDP